MKTAREETPRRTLTGPVRPSTSDMVGWHNGNAFRKVAEARGETLIKLRRGGEGNPEDVEE